MSVVGLRPLGKRYLWGLGLEYSIITVLIEAIFILGTSTYRYLGILGTQVYSNVYAEAEVAYWGDILYQ